MILGNNNIGRVRASVLDAFSENYHVALAEEGCFDRSQASHAINLCDMNAKYADVISTTASSTISTAWKTVYLTCRRANSGSDQRDDK